MIPCASEWGVSSKAEFSAAPSQVCIRLGSSGCITCGTTTSSAFLLHIGLKSCPMRLYAIGSIIFSMLSFPNHILTMSTVEWPMSEIDQFCSVRLVIIPLLLEMLTMQNKKAHLLCLSHQCIGMNLPRRLLLGLQLLLIPEL